MNQFSKSVSHGKTVLAFLVVALLVGAAAYAGNLYGLSGLSGISGLSWAEEDNVAGGSANPLPGLGPDTIPDIVAKVSPAVVRIDTTEQTSYSTNIDPLFRQFFGQNIVPSQPRVSNGLGSGFIVSADGYILTNEHVVSAADSIEITVAGYDQPFPARKIGSDHDLDLAVLKIDAAEALPTISLGNSDNIRVGDWVIAIGNPYGLDHTVTVGVISATGRPISVQDRQYKNLLQTDASINPGNSGGPLLNLNGDVVGINTAINYEAQGIGFAIPSSTVNAVFSDLVNKGGVDHPWLGVHLQSVTSEMARYFGLSSTSGVMVAQVVEGGPAAQAGLQGGDVITSYNGSNVGNPDELVDLVNETVIGSKVEIGFIRGGKDMTVSVTIAAKD